jgi:hypothetical protein
VKYRTSEWSMPAILSSVVWALSPTSVVAAVAPFMAANLVTMGSSSYEKRVHANDDSVSVRISVITADQASSDEWQGMARPKIV